MRLQPTTDEGSHCARRASARRQSMRRKGVGEGCAMYAAFVLGIDVSKQHLQATLVAGWRPDQPEWSGEFKNTPQGVRVLLRKLPADTALVVEPTGRYAETIVREGWAAGFRVLLASPRRARHYLRSRDRKSVV